MVSIQEAMEILRSDWSEVKFHTVRKEACVHCLRKGWPASGIMHYNFVNLGEQPQ